MAGTTEPCCFCSLFGFRVFCITPKQTGPDLDFSVKSQTGGRPTTREEQQLQTFAIKKRRERWARNILLVLYCLAGLGGLAMLTTELIGYKLRSPKWSAQNSYTATGKNFFDEDLVPDRDSLDLSDILLLDVSCGTVCLALMGIAAAMKKKNCCVNILSLGFLLAIAIQVGAGVVIWAMEVNASYKNPYVSTQVQFAVKKNLQNCMALYNKDPFKRELWDELQYQRCCCGITGPEEWEAYTQVPKSCHCVCMGRTYGRCGCASAMDDDYFDRDNCGYKAEQLTLNITVPKMGCLESILHKIGDDRKEIVKVVSIIAFSLTFFQLLAALGPLLALCCRCCCTTTGDLEFEDDTCKLLTPSEGNLFGDELNQSCENNSKAENMN